MALREFNILQSYKGYEILEYNTDEGTYYEVIKLHVKEYEDKGCYRFDTVGECKKFIREKTKNKETFLQKILQAFLLK